MQTADERNVFAIYVSYYVKVKLALSGMGGEVSLKLPFILGHVDDDDDDADKLDGQPVSSIPHNTTQIIEEECGQDEGNCLSPLVQEQLDSRVVTLLSTPNKKDGQSKNDCDNIVSFENDDTDEAVVIENKLKITHMASTSGDNASDTETIDNHDHHIVVETDENSVNIITAQIHHHPPNEEQTDC